MKAVILASGLGTRLADAFPDIPKPLIPVTSIPILGRMLENLRGRNLSEIIITTGYRSTQIDAFIASCDHRGLPRIRTVLNPEFKETNYIFSLWLTRGFLTKEDVLLIHGDMLIDTSLLDRVIGQTGSAVTVSSLPVTETKDFIARVRNHAVVEIGVGMTGPDTHACMPVYRWSSQDFAVWMRSINSFIQAGKRTNYAEDAFNALDGAVPLTPVWYEHELCMEIDSQEDLLTAERLLASRENCRLPSCN